MSPSHASPELTHWLPSFVATESQADRVGAWAGRTREGILRQMPEIEEIDGLPDRIESTVAEHWLALLAQLAQPQMSFHLVPQGREVARDLAELQVPLESLIRFYRVAQQTSWSYITQVVGDLPAEGFDHAEVLIYFWDRASSWIDESITASITIYQEAANRAQAGTAARLYEATREVLAGESDDTRRISAALGGYPVSAVHHTALILATPDHQTTGDLEQVARRLGQQVGSSDPLLVRPGGRQLWVWLATRDVPDTSSLATLFADSAPSDSVAGLGLPGTGLDGFIASHEDASGALRIASLRGRPGMVDYAEVEQLVLLGCSPRVDRFVRRTLASLVAHDEAGSRVRETVQSFLLHGGNVDETAQALSVHRNTVRYRMRQAEGALGRPIGKIGPELALALAHIEVFHHDGSLASLT